MPERATLDDRIAALASHWDVLLPPGAGPFPVAVQLHGCGGKKPFQLAWAEAARGAGAAVIIVDSHTPRSISQADAYARVCTGLRLPGRERAGDLFAALAWARRQDWTDPARLIAAGWSHGGWTIADALSLRCGAEMARATGIVDLPEEPLAGLAGAFLVYPYLGPGVLARRAWRIAPRTLAIVAGRDHLRGGPPTYRLQQRLRTQGGAMEVVHFDGASHAFDEPEAWAPWIRYDAALTARARGHYAELIRSLSVR